MERTVTGAFGPALRGKLKHGNQRAQISHVIQNGVPGTQMSPAKLKPAVLASVTDYILSLQQRDAK